jgi:hypothetical protein
MDTLAERPRKAPVQALVLKRVRKGGKRYTRGSKGPQRLGLGLAKASRRTAEALASGLETFDRKSRKSAKKKRDGMLRDSVKNAARGLADSLKELRRAPRALAESVGTRRLWRRGRKIIKGLGRSWPAFLL